MSISSREALQAVLDATPEPPSNEVDAADVLARAEEMVARREGPVAALVSLLDRDPNLAEECRDLAATLRDRDARWLAVLTAAREELSTRVVAFSRMRNSRYSR